MSNQTECPVTHTCQGTRYCDEGACPYNERCKDNMAACELHEAARKYTAQRLDLLLQGVVPIDRESVGVAITTATIMTHQVCEGADWLSLHRAVVEAAREWAGQYGECDKPCPRPGGGCYRKGAIAREVIRL